MADKKQDYYLTSPIGGNENVIGNAFVSGYKANNGAYDAAGIGLTGLHPNGHSANLLATNIPKFGNQVTAGVSANIVHTKDHKLDVNAFNTTTFPHHHPSFSTHGGGVDYMFKEKVGASANMAHTPMFKQTDTSIGARLNLHQTPNSSFNLNVGANKSTSPFTPNQGFQPSFFFSFIKKF